MHGGQTKLRTGTQANKMAMIVVVMIMATISSDILSPPVDGLLPNSGQMDFPKPQESQGEKVVARSYSPGHCRL
jgi:hypothetical protein